MTKTPEISTFQIGQGPKHQISAAEIASGWQEHRNGDPFMQYLEDYSKEFLAAGMPDADALLFVRLVCAWGGLRGNNFPLFKGDAEALSQKGRSLASVLRESKELSESRQFQKAIKSFDGLRGLGVSFRSKVLRFLCPDYAAVLDSIIRKKLGYKNTAKSYATFVNDCISIRDRLNGADYPHPLGRYWETTDVEMGIFVNVKAEP